MPENPPKDVLLDILRVLERIETKLEGHEDRFRQLEEAPWTPKGRVEKDDDETTADTLSSSLGTAKVENTTESSDADGVRPGPKIPYGDWSIDRFIQNIAPSIYGEIDISVSQLERFYILSDLSPELKRRVGACWDMPDDNRFPLKFFKSNILKTYLTGGGPHIDTFSKAKQKIEHEMSLLCDFDRSLRVDPGNDFVVVDYDSTNNSRMYRVGQPAIGAELMIDPHEVQKAPWSRLILYQGATTGDSIDTERKRPELPIPYFSRTDRVVGVWDHLLCHLRLTNRSTTTNPYLSRWTGFHTTFYEIIEAPEVKSKELWKHGPLYDHPLGWNFRKCAFTLYTPASPDSALSSAQKLDNGNVDITKHWTLLVLAPNKFFNEHIIKFPSVTTEIDYNTSQVTFDPLGKLTLPGAELKFIGQGLEKISERWSDFQAYFDYMLDSGNTLMHPNEHDKLLFDDGSFSRSRRYFWAIDCLSEFDNSISDNLTQWEQYRVARVDPIIHLLPDLDRRLLSHVERQYQILQNQREAFRRKLAAIKALRDALFNASAVIESRASTRLGENVKLLTFVSIFFLPLSFTTSLWSINDSFSQKVLIYVIIIVALVTYLAMFNINSLAQAVNDVYDLKKKRIVRSMKADRSNAWRERGRRFEVFRPKHENPEPSEWLIPLYAIMHPGSLLGIIGGRRSEAVAAAGQRTRIARLLRRQKPEPQEIGRTDEGWVL